MKHPKGVIWVIIELTKDSLPICSSLVQKE